MQAWARHEAKAGQADEAGELFERATQLEPDNAYVLQACGACCL